MDRGARHRPESNYKNSLAHMGKKYPPRSEESRKRSSEAIKKYYMNNPVTEEQREILRKRALGREHSRETRIKMSLAHPGEKCHLYRGGRAISRKLDWRIRRCFEYRLWRSDVFKRDDFTCQECGIRGSNLEAHHVKTFNNIVVSNHIKTFEEAIKCSELWDINNGKTLCKDCHNKTKIRRNNE